MELSPLPGVLASGERIAPLSEALRKDKRAFRGILLPVNTPPRRKLRRKIRGATNRNRVSRRPNPAGRRAVIWNTRHWSEKRDQEFRTATLRHKRVSYAKRVSRALNGKFRSRHQATIVDLQGAKKVNGARLARFVSSRHFAAVGEKQGQANNRPSGNVLLQSSSFIHRRRLTKTSQSKLAWLRQRSYRAPRRSRRKERFYRAKSNFRTTQECSALSARLVSALNSEESVTSL
jgi:hypothetical protein